MQIKYLRVPDMLLDVVKEEQTRAREAGKSARGGAHTGGIGGRGAEHVLPLRFYSLITLPLLQVAAVHREVSLLRFIFLPFSSSY